jgi:hypothetical protein
LNIRGVVSVLMVERTVASAHSNSAEAGRIASKITAQLPQARSNKKDGAKRSQIVQILLSRMDPQRTANS